MSCSCEDLGRGPQHIFMSAIARIELVHEYVDELRDVLRRAAMNDIEVVRRDGRALRYRGEEANDDELNVARR